MKVDNEFLKNMYEMAKEASKNSYSPYSEFPVGAAILMENGKIFTGANIENRSYGLTNCAERSAVFAGASQGYREIFAVAISTPASDYPVGPCGACRQVLSEFGKEDVPVIFGPTYEKSVIKTLGELYPFDSLHELSKD